MRCRGCGAAIPRDYMHRTFTVDRLVFCVRTCFDQHAERLLKIFVPVMRHVATKHRGKSADLISMALNADTPVELL